MIAADVRTRTEPTAAEVGSHRRVLVVEGDAELRHQLAAALERAGYEVVQAATREELCLELLLSEHAGPHWTPAALIAGSPSSAEGLDLVADVRRRWWWLPVVLVTGGTSELIRHRARAFGCCYVIARPVQVAQVILVVRQVAR